MLFFDLGSRPSQELPHVVVGRQLRPTEVRAVETASDIAHRSDFKAFGDLRLAGDQLRQPSAQRVRERRGERRQEHAGIRVRTGQVDRAVQRHDGLAGTRRSRYARRAVEAPFHHLPLRRMQEDRPLLPRVFQCPLQLFLVGHDPEAALRVGMGVRVSVRGRARRPLRRAAGGKCQQSFGGLSGEVIRDLQEGIFVVHLPDVSQPFGRNAVVQQLVVSHP